jgi:hypothetical protein
LGFVLADLQNRTGDEITFEMLEDLAWEIQSFPDSSLGCPAPGEVYTEVVSDGYVIVLNYEGKIYNYRVTENGEMLVLCENITPVVVTSTPNPEAPTATATLESLNATPLP